MAIDSVGVPAQAPLRVLADMARILESRGDPPVSLRQALGLLRRAVPYDGCSLVEVLPEGGHCFLLLPARRRDEKKLKEALVDCLRLVSEDDAPPLTDGSYPQMAKVFPWQSYLGVPLVGLDRVLGLLFVGQTKREAYGEEHLSLLSVAGSQIAAYLTAQRSRESERHEMGRTRFQAYLLDSVQEAVMAVDREGRIAYCNGFARKLYGLPDDAVGRLRSELVESPEWEETQQRALRGETFSAEMAAMRGGGTEMAVWTTFSPWYDFDGNIVGTIGVSQDITKRREVEEAREKAEQELRALNEELTLINLVSNILLTVPDDDMYDQVLQVLLDITHSAYGVFGYVDEDGALVEPALTQSASRDCDVSDRRMVFPLEGRIQPVKVAFEEGKGAYYNRRFSPPEGHVPIERLLVAPIMRGAKPIGRIMLANKATDYTEEDLERVMRLVRWVAPILDARLQREREENARRRAESRLDMLVEEAPLGLAMLDREGRYLLVNPKLAEMNGIPAEAHIGRTVEEMLPRFWPRVEPFFRRILEEGAEGLRFEVEGQTNRESGVKKVWQETWYPVKDEQGETVGVGAFVEDITEQKRAQQELEKAQLYARRLFESSLIGVVNWEGAYMTDANEAFFKMTGYTREDLPLNWMDITPPEWRQADEEALKAIREQGESPVLAKEYRRKDGERLPVLIGAVSLSADGSSGVVFVVDMTEQKRMEQELARVRTEFLGVVSHELKTPLTAIKGSVSMGLSGRVRPSPEETRELFEVIDEQSERMRELISNLLDMTRMEAGRFGVNPGPEKVSEIIEDATLSFLRGGTLNELRTEVAADVPAVMADRRRVVQVLTNLLRNATAASVEGGPIAITAEREREWVLVKVRDYGRGIPEEKMALLFEKYSQVHETGRRGTGLGLAISRGIVEAHGGRIWAESGGVGEGATFKFTLPVADERVAQSERRGQNRL